MSKGTPITNYNSLKQLVEDKRSVYISCGNSGYRVPASTLMFRIYSDTARLINDGRVYEWIKESNRPNRPNKPRPNRHWGYVPPIVVDNKPQPALPTHVTEVDFIDINNEDE
jgi:hypothetical protein